MSDKIIKRLKIVKILDKETAKKIIKPTAIKIAISVTTTNDILAVTLE
jgi:hypothetical protein